MVPFMVFALTGVINKRDLEQINWSVIWMVAGGFALGYGLNASGLAANAVESIPFGEFSPLLILLLGGAICYLLSNFISNSATAALLMPILAIVCGAMGDKLAPIGGTPTVLIGVAIAASSAMILPISTPPNALAFATGYVKQNDMAKMGIMMGVISMVLGFGLVYFAPLLALHHLSDGIHATGSLSGVCIVGSRVDAKLSHALLPCYGMVRHGVVEHPVHVEKHGFGAHCLKTVIFQVFLNC
jgi:sodium-dependent dicarboxylate transporter 2/3/5